MPEEEQVKTLMQMFPNLDRLMCETLLKTPPERLQELLACDSPREPPESYVMQTVRIE